MKRNWPVLLISLAVPMAAAGVYTASHSRVYVATTELFLRAPDVKSSSSAYQGDLFSRQRAVTYMNMFKSQDLAQMVIDKLQLNSNPRQLVSKVVASTVKDTVLLDVSVEDGNAQQAANIANAYGAVFGDYIAKIEDVEFNRDIPPLVQVISMATAVDAKEKGLSPEIAFTAAALVGLVVGVGSVKVLEHYDPRIRSRVEIEDLLGTQIIGTLPRGRLANAGSQVGNLGDEDRNFERAAVRLSISIEYALRQLPDLREPPVIAIVSAGEFVSHSVVVRAVTQGFASRGRTVGVVPQAPLPDANADVATNPSESGPIRQRHRRLETGGAVRKDTIHSVVDELRTHCDVVLIDIPHFEVSAGVELVAEVADAVAVVVGIGETTRESLSHLIAEVDILGTPRIGTVIYGARA